MFIDQLEGYTNLSYPRDGGAIPMTKNRANCPMEL